MPRRHFEHACGRLRAAGLRGLGRPEQRGQAAGAYVAPLEHGGGRGAVLTQHLEQGLGSDRGQLPVTLHANQQLQRRGGGGEGVKVARAKWLGQSG